MTLCCSFVLFLPSVTLTGWIQTNSTSFRGITLYLQECVWDQILRCVKVPPSHGSLSSPPVRSPERVFVELVLVVCKSIIWRSIVWLLCPRVSWQPQLRVQTRPRAWRCLSSSSLRAGASGAVLRGQLVGWWALPAFLGDFWVCFVSLINYVTFSAGSYKGLRLSAGIFLSFHELHSPNRLKQRLKRKRIQPWDRKLTQT